MDHVKCTCGHANPPGTTICESCGKPLEESDGLLNMRYEGAARRSQVRPRGILDYVWNFFSSVKIAIWLILITLLAAAVGTVFPQEEFKQSALPAEVFYPQTYGTLGKIYYLLGFHKLYTQWWFILLLLLIGISLVICSLDRVIPLYRALNRQRIPKHLDFYRRQRFFLELDAPPKELDRLEQALRKRHYRLKKEDSGMLAEKGRFSRWGPYINHIGLILFILAVMLRMVPGFYLDEYVWLWEGETKKVPGTEYYVKNEDSKIEFYSEDEFPQKLDIEGEVVKNYQTNAVLYQKEGDRLVELHRQEIRVNHPLEYEGLLLYQNAYLPNQLYAFRLGLYEKESNRRIGQFEVNLYNPPPEIDLGNGYKVVVSEYYPDFALNEKNEPYTKSPNPNRPAFVFIVHGPDRPEGEKTMLVTGVDLDDLLKMNRYKIEFEGATVKDRTGLAVRMDKGLPMVYVAAFIVFVGLVMGFYWQHRRIWLRTENGRLYLAAHTNKNWFSLRRELETILREAGLTIPIETIDQGGKRR